MYRVAKGAYPSNSVEPTLFSSVATAGYHEQKKSEVPLKVPELESAVLVGGNRYSLHTNGASAAGRESSTSASTPRVCPAD